MQPIPDPSKLEAVMRYHERTKHHFARFAPGPGRLDWANQPDPFRRLEGAPLTRLPLLAPHAEPRPPEYESLYAPGTVASVPLGLRALSRLLEYALALSAWKQAGETRWALRVNPSSGNLHPTEGYVFISSIPELGESPGLFHYAPREHALERRADCAPELYARLLRGFPGGAVVGLLARGMEVRRARFPLLPARRRPRHRHAEHRRRDARLVGTAPRRGGRRHHRRAPGPGPRCRLRGHRARKRGAGDGAMAGTRREQHFQPRGRGGASAEKSALVRTRQPLERGSPGALGCDRRSGRGVPQTMTSAGQ